QGCTQLFGAGVGIAVHGHHTCCSLRGGGDRTQRALIGGELIGGQSLGGHRWFPRSVRRQGADSFAGGGGDERTCHGYLTGNRASARETIGRVRILLAIVLNALALGAAALLVPGIRMEGWSDDPG